MTERFTSSDGVQIAFHRWAGAGDGRPPVLLHHGFAASTEINWVAPGVVAALTAAGREVIGIDARGHGQSDAPHDPALYGEPRMAADVSLLLDHLGIDLVDLAGYSMGAIVSLHVGTQEPRVRRLVIGGIGGAVADVGRGGRRLLDGEGIARALLAPDGDAITDPSAKLFRAFAQSTGADLAALAAQARSVHTGPIAFERITAPALVLVGKDDALGRNADRLAAAIGDARLEVVGGDHLTAVADARFAPAIVEFFGEP